MKGYFLATIILFSLTGSLAQKITWSGNTDVLDIAQHISVYRETDSVLSIEEISSGKYDSQFMPSGQRVIHMGFTESVYWFSFSLINDSGDSLWLQLEHAFVPLAQLYFKNETGDWIIYRAGYETAMPDKAIKDHYQVFPLLRGDHEYYLRLKPLVHPIPVKIWKTQTYEIKITRQRIIYGVYSGILLFAIAINIFLFFAFRKLYYLLYAALVFMYLAASAGVMEGYAIYFFPGFNLMDGYRIIPVLNMPILLAYCISFLELKKYSAFLYRITFIACALLLVYISVMHFFPQMLILLVNYLLALLVFILAIVIGIVVGRRGNRMGFYFVVAYSVWLILLSLEEIYIQTGVPPHIFDLSYVSIAIFIESVLLAFLLVKRFQWDKKADEKAKFELQTNIVRMQAKFEQELLKTKLEIQEQTFNNISQEIHDNIGQTLTLAKLNLSLFISESGLTEKDLEKLAVSKSLVTTVIRELRDISKAMNTDYIRTTGLTSAIEQQIEILKRTGAFKVHLTIEGEVERYDTNKELFVFRVVQELINNIVKHAGATVIEITVEYKTDSLQIIVTDNGKGFDPNQVRGGDAPGIGLYNIMDRIKLLNGEVILDSKVNSGTRVTFSIPK